MTLHPLGLERQSPKIHNSGPAGFTRYELTMSGAALGWGLIVHHVTVHAFFHIALRFVLKIGGMLMGEVTEMVKSLKNMSGSLVSEFKELSTLALVTVAASIQGPGNHRGLFRAISFATVDDAAFLALRECNSTAEMALA